MNKKDIPKEIVRLKLLKPQTQETKFKIQKLQQQISNER